MANSFGDQLVKAGLVNRDRLNKAKKSKHKQKMQQKGAVVSEAAESARRAAAEKLIPARTAHRDTAKLFPTN